MFLFKHKLLLWSVEIFKQLYLLHNKERLFDAGVPYNSKLSLELGQGLVLGKNAPDKNVM